MKFSKLLAPVLAVASAGAITVPFVTSCNKGYGGVEVTAEQWSEAFAYYASITATHDFTSKVTAKSGSESESFTIKVTEYKESLVSGDTTIFFKNAATKAERKYWTGQAWASSDEFVASDIVVQTITSIGTLTYSTFEYKNGGYVAEEGDNKIVVIMTKVGENYRIKGIEAKTANDSAKLSFSNYGSTKIDNFPA